ncbi:unnamed protein product [Caenorhabditis brenneri]
MLFTCKQPKPTVKLDEETYRPGDTVTGTATVTITKEQRARSITVYWSGRGHDYISPDFFIDNCPERQFLEGKETVWREFPGETTIPIGTYNFPFFFKLPDKIHSSFYPRDEHNARYLVKYYVKVVVDIPFHFDLKNKIYFRVVNGIPHPDLRVVVRYGRLKGGSDEDHGTRVVCTARSRRFLETR